MVSHLYISGFNDSAQQYGYLLLEGGCYRISGCNVQRAKQIYSGVDHKWEVILGFFAQVTPIVKFQPKFTPRITPLDEIAHLSEEVVYVNVMGVISDAEDPYFHSARKTGRTSLRRNLKLYDRSSHSVWLAVYGDQAGKVGEAVINEQIVLVKEAKICRFGENKYNLQTWFDRSRMVIDPPGKEAEDLRQWWKCERSNERKRLMIGHDSINPLNLQNVRPTHGTQETKSFSLAETKIAEHMSKNTLREEYFHTLGSVTIVKRDNFIYTGCPVISCRKKVDIVTRPSTSGNSSNLAYFCPKCDKTYNNYLYGFALKVFIKDYSGGRWATVFNDQAMEFLENSPEETIKLREELSGFDFEHIMNHRLFESYVFYLRAYVSRFFDDKRVEYNVISMMSVTQRPVCISSGLLEEIRTLENS